MSYDLSLNWIQMQSNPLASAFWDLGLKAQGPMPHLSCHKQKQKQSSQASLSYATEGKERL